MVDLQVLLPSLLYSVLIVLVIFLIMFVVRLIRVINKVDGVLDDVSGKLDKLDKLFELIDCTTEYASSITDKLSASFKGLINFIAKRKKGRKIDE